MPEHYKGPVLAPVAGLKKIKLVKRQHCSLSYQLYGTIDDVIQRLMNLKDVTPTVVRTFKFSPDQIKNLIADELDFDPKTVKISFNLDHNDMVKDIVLEVKQ